MNKTTQIDIEILKKRKYELDLIIKDIEQEINIKELLISNGYENVDKINKEIIIINRLKKYSQEWNDELKIIKYIINDNYKKNNKKENNCEIDHQNFAILNWRTEYSEPSCNIQIIAECVSCSYKKLASWTPKEIIKLLKIKQCCLFNEEMYDEIILEEIENYEPN